MEFLFILRYLSHLLNDVNLRGVDRGVADSTYFITQTAFLTHDIISNAPGDNTINRIQYY